IPGIFAAAKLLRGDLLAGLVVHDDIYSVLLRKAEKERISIRALDDLGIQCFRFVKGLAVGDVNGLAECRKGQQAAEQGQNWFHEKHLSAQNSYRRSVINCCS